MSGRKSLQCLFCYIQNYFPQYCSTTRFSADEFKKHFKACPIDMKENVYGTLYICVRSNNSRMLETTLNRCSFENFQENTLLNKDSKADVSKQEHSNFIFKSSFYSKHLMKMVFDKLQKRIF